MNFSQQSPTGRLSSVVKIIWRARGTKAEFSAPAPIVPDGCVEIIFNLADPFVGGDGQPQPRALLAGQMTRPVVAVPTGTVDLIGVRFLTARAGRAFRLPMSELQDALLDASTVFARLGALTDDLLNLPDEQRLAYLETHLPVDTASNPSAAAVVDRTLALIEGARGRAAIDHIAAKVGISRRQLERRFKNEVGLGVKQLSRIVRIQEALALLRRRPELGGAEISARCGYSDQAHLIRECRALAGFVPTQVAQSGDSLGPLLRSRRD